MDRHALWLAVVLRAVLILCRNVLPSASLELSGAQRGMRFVRLNQTNVYNGKCLDGSEPGVLHPHGQQGGRAQLGRAPHGRQLVHVAQSMRRARAHQPRLHAALAGAGLPKLLRKNERVRRGVHGAF
ncbi:hypothetical protein CLOM_g11005 [Closterium sp. NIES-68]|nr:hypothetical protein CLOM_g11005 [Closterium sp. NIES-68]